MVAGLEKFSRVHPVAVSLANVAVARRVPVLVHRCPTCVHIGRASCRESVTLREAPADFENNTGAQIAQTRLETGTAGIAAEPQELGAWPEPGADGRHA